MVKENTMKPTEIGLIPEDWEVVSLSDCSKRITDGEHLTPKRTETGYLLLSARNILNGRIDLSDVDYVGFDEYQRIRARCNPEFGDVLISCSGSIGRVATVPKDFQCVMVRSAALLKPDFSIASGHYIQFFLQSSVGQNQIFTSMNQGAQPNLFLNHINGIRIAFPLLPEQQAIAEALSDADAWIKSLEDLIAKKRLIKQGAMQELLTPKEGWEVKKLGEVAEIIMGQSPLSKFYNNSGKGLPLVQGNADIENRKTIIRNYTSQITKKGKSGDIIMSVRAPVGEIATAQFDCCLGRGVCAFRTDNKFLYHLLIHIEADWGQFSTGSTFDSVNSNQIIDLEINAPKSRTEQIRIATILSDMDAEIEQLEQKLTKARQLKQGMMQELLTGRVRLV
jgi:type I restriction enzyme S subunit